MICGGGDRGKMSQLLQVLGGSYSASVPQANGTLNTLLTVPFSITNVSNILIVSDNEMSTALNPAEVQLYLDGNLVAHQSGQTGPYAGLSLDVVGTAQNLAVGNHVITVVGVSNNYGAYNLSGTLGAIVLVNI